MPLIPVPTDEERDALSRVGDMMRRLPDEPGMPDVDVPRGDLYAISGLMDRTTEWAMRDPYASEVLGAIDGLLGALDTAGKLGVLTDSLVSNGMTLAKITMGMYSSMRKPTGTEHIKDDACVHDMCRGYVQTYESVCRAYLRPIADAIADRAMGSCGKALRVIREYDAGMAHVLGVFDPRIRNAIAHHAYYVDRVGGLVKMPRDDGGMFQIEFEQLDAYCKIAAVTGTCFGLAHRMRLAGGGGTGTSVAP